MQYFVSEWKKLTSDKKILDIVQHCHIEFVDNIRPSQTKFQQRVFSGKDSLIIDSQIKKLLQQDVIKLVEFTEGQFLSPIFLRMKKNGEYRLILNLKELNQHIVYRHFKMDTFENAITLITKNMYMCSLDIRHAYYSIKIADEDQIYLRFMWRGKIYQFSCCPNGISPGPLWFTKLMKPVYSALRNMGHISTGFIDDSLLGGQTVERCLENVQDTTELMTKLGFMLNYEKSILIPTTKITHLGFTIDSEKMIVTLPQEKIEIIQTECLKLYEKTISTIRNVAKVIGILVASFSAVEFGKLHYREMEREKAGALKVNRGNYDASMHVSIKMKEELQWWFTNVHKQFRKIDKGNPETVIQTDSSLLGWGFVYEGNKAGGRWTDQEKTLHINVLELKAILFALKALGDKIRNKHVKVLSDSTTAVCYVTNFGGCKSVECNEVSKSIWSWCIENHVWVSCAHIAGKQNEADAPSRQFNDRLEWELRDDVFQDVCKLWQQPSIDLFASRLNNKVGNYCSYKPDPYAAHIDAFTIDWGKFNCCYIFSPFSMTSRCITKVKTDRAQAILVCPLWPTQYWFPALMNILVDRPRVIRRSRTLLTLPHTDEEHPLWRKLTLIVCRVSGIPSEAEDFQRKQPVSSLLPGENLPEVSTAHTSPNGYFSVVNNRLVRYLHL